MIGRLVLWRPAENEWLPCTAVIVFFIEHLLNPFHVPNTVLGTGGRGWPSKDMLEVDRGSQQGATSSGIAQGDARGLIQQGQVGLYCVLPSLTGHLQPWLWKQGGDCQ